jgi:hypothetical protein
MRGLRLTLLAGVLFTASAGPNALTPEYELKAHILVDLLPYVQARPEPGPRDRPFSILVLGRSPFGAYLDDYARTRTIQKRPIRTLYARNLSEAAACDAVFICRSEIRRADAILGWAQARHAITLSDDEALAQRGVVLNLLMEGRFVRLAVNPEAATAAGVVISSQLLRNARMLTPKRLSSSAPDRGVAP